MDIIILANFCGALNGKDNDRFIYLAQLLCKNNNVEVITSNFSHGHKEHRNRKINITDYKVTQIYEPGYSKNVSLKRFYSHYKWGENVKKYILHRKKPDVVYCAIPSLTGPNLIAKYCEKNKIPFVVDVQDLWPEAFHMVCHIPVLSNLLFWPFKKLADGIYKKADQVIAVSQTYVNRVLAVNRKVRNGYTVYLGTDLKIFDANVKKNKVSSKKKGELWLGYCGTLAASYDLITVMDSITLLKEKDRKMLKFIVMGDGARREEFEIYAKKTGVQCVFTGNLPYDRMCGILNACDIVVNPITRGSVASIINKHADYAASGKPVINTQESREYWELVDKYQMGLNCENANASDMADKLNKLICDAGLRELMGNNARKCAEEKFDRSSSYLKIIDLILQSAKIKS